jgi:hypothetical protein
MNPWNGISDLRFEISEKEKEEDWDGSWKEGEVLPGGLTLSQL